MEATNSIKEQARDHEVLAHEFRLFILNMLKEHGGSTWTDIVTGLEKYSKKRLNPNSVNFHLSRLIEAGFIEKKETAGEIRYGVTSKARNLHW